uniref:GRAM domain-containing protein 1A n=1 Tax=Anthurium amnicola TaxID=1678845 RepID=A0A1D1YKF4_9ARAE
MAVDNSHGGREIADQLGPPDRSPSRRPSSPSVPDADADIMTQVLSTKSEEYRQLFRLPKDDVLIQDFNCALHENFLIQGHMYLFVHHICFYANIFGFETKRTIPFHEVTTVRKAKTAGIFPNAIEIMVGEKKHFFGSFLSRDEAHRLILEGWPQHSGDANKFIDPQDSMSENSGQDNALVMLESIKDSNPPTTADLNFADSLPAGFSEIQVNGVESVGCASLGVSSAWQLDDVDTPNVPEYFTMVAEAKFPISIEDFFHYFFSDDAIEFFQNFRRTCGDTDFRCSPWRRHEQFGHVRDLSFNHPIKIIFGPKSGNCRERQKFRAYRDRHLVIETSQQISDVPFGDNFHVEGLWDVEQDCNEENSCHMKVYINVAFSRKLLWKGKIEQSTQVECREVFGTWIKNAHELLGQRTLRKDQDVPSCTTDITQDNDIVSERLSKLGHLECSCVTMFSKRMPLPLPDFRNHCSRICGSMQETLRLSTFVVSIIKESCNAFCVHLKRQPNLHLTLALAFVAVSFLMQLAIILLLTKSPRIHIISQGNYINSLGDERSETIHWLEERVHHLNQEMQMMESRLERMRHEYMFLRTHLQDLYMHRTER